MSAGYRRLAGTDYDTLPGNFSGPSGGLGRNLFGNPNGSSSTSSNLKKWVLKVTKEDMEAERQKAKEQIPEFPL